MPKRWIFLMLTILLALGLVSAALAASSSALQGEDCSMYGSREASNCPDVLPHAWQPEASGSGTAVTRQVNNLVEGFDDITLLPGAGWFLINNSEPLGIINWFQGNSGVFAAHQGAPTAYIAANFNNTAGTGTISNWLLTPVLTLADGSTFTFWTRTVAGSSFPDRLQVRMSLAGSSTDVGATSTSVGDFTNLLLDINPAYTVGGFPEAWTAYTLTLSGIGVPTNGRLAFRYFVENGGPTGANSNYIGIDTVEYTPMPAISFSKTVGAVVTGTSLCPLGESITIPAPAEVTYCYRVENTGAVTLTMHDVVDSELGSLLSMFAFGLTPGSSAFFTQTANITQTTINTATWTAYNPGPADLVSASDIATVTLPAEIDVDPAMLTSLQAPNKQVVQQLTINNSGGSPLDWNILEGAPTPRPDPARPARTPGQTGQTTEAAASAQPAGLLDCAAYENYVGAEPAGYAEACLGIATPLRPHRASSLSPTDMGFAQDLGFVSDNFVSFTLNDFPSQTVVATSTLPIFGMDFDENGAVLYGINNSTDEFGTIDQSTAAFTPIGPLSGTVGDTWTGLSIDPTDGMVYASSTNGMTATLYTVDKGTGMSTPIGPVPGAPLLIDIAIGPSGLMYGHDIGSDAIFQIDKTSGAATEVGPTGYFANFAQGMDFDNDDGTLYIFLYQGGGANVYGTVDLVTGAVTPLAQDNPLGEFEGATQTVSPCDPGDLPWLALSPSSGTTAAGDSSVVDVTFDSTGLAPGDYAGSLCVLSNDVQNPVVTVPLTLTVEIPDIYLPIMARN